MRKIPIYDTSGEELTQHICEMDMNFIGPSNLQEYIDRVCDHVGCVSSEHLEISRNSNQKMGRTIRTASLNIKKGDKIYSAESLYQGSKIFKNSGSNHSMYENSGNSSLSIKSGWKHKTIVGVDFFGFLFPVTSLSDLHDVLYWRGLMHTCPQIYTAMKILEDNGVNYFTDCFDGPGRNSQSNSFSKFYLKFKKKESIFLLMSDYQKSFWAIIENDLRNEMKYECKEGNIALPLF